jgi:hypothetical protein
MQSPRHCVKVMPVQTTYFEFEVSLDGVQPRIWRRFLLRRNSTFHELHDTIQIACGWQDYHLYEFREWAEGQDRWQSRKGIACSPYSEFMGDEDPVPFGPQVKLGSFFRKAGDRCLYLYDFGDGWCHQVELKDIRKQAGQFRRHMLAGERAFPPEDCGGIGGYEECLQAFKMTEVDLTQLDDDERGEMESRKTWMGNWNPEGFDFEVVAKEMRQPVNY